ncbi:MAG TPA: glycosyltransferase family 9 protein [Nannocystis sp.]
MSPARDLRPALDPPPRSVLVLRALPGLGDFLCATPALRALRAALPGARITLLGVPPARALMPRYRHLLDDFLDFPGFPGLPEVPVDVAALPGFLRAVQGRFDLALQLHGSGIVSSLFIQLLGARVAAGFYAPPLPCPDLATFMPYPAGLPEPLALLALLRFLGIPARGHHLEFPIGPADDTALTVLLRRFRVPDDIALALLHVGATQPARRLAPALAARVADGLAARGFRVLLTGSDGERPLVGAVRTRATSDPLDLAGRTTLPVLAALVRRARLVVTCDTGLSHLAAALRTPSVVVFLASDPRRWAPLDHARHRPLDGTRLPPTPDAILAEVDLALAAAPTACEFAPDAIPAARHRPATGPQEAQHG